MVEFIYGRNAVYETLRAQRREVMGLQIADGVKPAGRVEEIMKLAAVAKVPATLVPRAKLEEETMALAQKIAERDPFALKLAKASVNETLDAQGWRQAMENAFKNYMLTIPHRQALGTYGAEARAKGVKQRIETRDQRFGDRPPRPR